VDDVKKTILNKNTPIILNNYLVNKTKYFHSTDSKEKYLENKNLLGKDWYYYDLEIEYKYNSWGYRTKNFEDINDDYVVTFGCSYTEGIGLEYKDIWPIKLGQKLNLDTLNLGVGGTGIDFQFYNTMLLQQFLLNNNKKLPKLVVYQWPHTTRVLAPFMDQDSLYFEFYSPHCKKQKGSNPYNEFIEWYYMGFVNNCGQQLFNSSMMINFANNVWKSLNIPVLNYTWENFNFKDTKSIGLNIDLSIFDDYKRDIKARDLSHSGRFTQDVIVENLIKILIEKNLHTAFSK